MFNAFKREFRIFGKKPTYYLVSIAVLSALGFVLMLPKIPIFAAFPFLGLDFGDVPVAIAALVFGPIGAATVALVKNALHLLASDTMFVGELSNFLLSLAFGLIISLIYNIKRGNLTLIISFIVATGAVIGMAILTNKYIMVPIFFGAEADPTMVNYYVYTIIPAFNAIKFSVESVTSALILFAVLRVPLFKKMDKLALPEKKKAAAPPVPASDTADAGQGAGLQG